MSGPKLTEDEVSVQKAVRAFVSFAKGLGFSDERIVTLVEEAVLTHAAWAPKRTK